jgi:GTPase Era involved in 16S rRNA processing
VSHLQVERLLDRVDAAIYLLDYTKLKTAEEAQVLERLKAINPGLVGRLSSRLFFAVNKIDQAEQSCGLGEDETREYVADLVTRQLNCPDFRLHPDQVGWVSGKSSYMWVQSPP